MRALVHLTLLLVCLVCSRQAAFAQGTLPVVGVHDSELTRALENLPATGQTPTGPGTTGRQWWPADWHYFVMPESLKETLRSDGTAFAVVGDAQIAAGSLLNNGLPRYPIVFSLASEAIDDREIAALTNYVAAGGFLFLGSSAFTRTTNGAGRGNFAFARELGVDMASTGLANWAPNSYFEKTAAHRLTSHIPGGRLTWRMPASAEEISWGTAPSHPFLAPHDIWQVRAADATVLASGDSRPLLLVKSFGRGVFIYAAPMQPLIGHGGFAPGMYAYGIVRNAVEWAFESARLAVPKISPWPYQYDAAFVVRHDLEDYADQIAHIEASARFESERGARGDYFFCTGTLREEMRASYDTNAVVASLRRAISNYGATIGPHNGGLKNPAYANLSLGDYDYWHWGPDEALDTSPAGYASGKAYAQASILMSFQNIESWLSGLMTSNQRIWVTPYFNGTREDSYDIQSQLGVKVAGDQKLSPFPHWTLSTRTAGKRYSTLTLPVSDWFVGGLVAQSLEPWHPPGVHTTATLRDAIDYYYHLGALVNFYSHTSSDGYGDAGQLASEYVTYSLNTNVHPRMWSANGLGVYQWWLQRSNVAITATASTNGNQFINTITVSGATHANTAVEVLVPPGFQFCALEVRANGQPAAPDSFRVWGNAIKVRVGTSVTNVAVSYYPVGAAGLLFSENFDGVVPPALPAGWSASASGALGPWETWTDASDSAPSSAFAPGADGVGSSELTSPVIALPLGAAQLTFRHKHDLEPGFDGGVLEIKVGGGPFTDILLAGGSFVLGGYTGTIDSGYGSPLAGRQSWSGNSSGFVTTTASLPATASGQPIQLRWRCASDSTTPSWGWNVDTIALQTSICLCCDTNANNPPVLGGQSDRLIQELTLLSVANPAADPDSGQSLTYRLVAPPAGATIDLSGLIAWTPGEAQGPGLYAFTTVVTDSGTPPLSATNRFTVTVTEVNRAPVLPLQADRTVVENSPLVVTNTATDADLPANQIQYALFNPPALASIGQQGVISWTPGSQHASTTHEFVTIATDNGSPPLSSTNRFFVTVLASTAPPAIVAQPASVISIAGTPAAFSVGATGNLLSYQWFKDGQPLPHATNAGFSLAAALPADAGMYHVRVANPYGVAISSNATLTVVEPIVIQAQPQSRTNLTGTTATFEVSVSGTTPTFRWRKDGTGLVSAGRISGATAAALGIASVTESDNGLYSVVVTNFAGSVTSSPARLSVVQSGGPPELRFSDDFARASLSPWTSHSGTWSISSGVLSGLAKGPNIGFVHLAQAWTNYSVEASLSFPSGAYGGGLGGRLNPGTGTHYAAWIFPENSAGGSRMLKLLKFKNWKSWSYNGVNSAPMQQAALAGVGTGWHTLKMAFSNSVITVWFDGAQAMRVTDTEANVYSSGTICLGADDVVYAMAADNVRVYTLGAPAYVPPRPRIGTIALLDDRVVLGWNAVTGVRYQIQFRDTLGTAAWTGLTPDILATSPTMYFTNSIGGYPLRFFRVTVAP